MYRRRFLAKNRKVEANQTSVENNRTPPLTSNITTAPTHNPSVSLASHDSGKPPEPPNPASNDVTTMATHNPSESDHDFETLPEPLNASSNVTTVPTHNPSQSDHDSETPLEPLNPSTYSSNVTTAPYTLSGRDSMRQPGSSLGLPEKSKVTTPNYIYYRIYAEDGAIPSKIPVTPGDPFLGRIKPRSVPPPGPRTVKKVKHSILEVENIKSTITSIFLTQFSQLPMGDAERVTILNGTGPGSTPQEPLALVAKLTNSERSALESDGRGGLASAADDTTSPEIQYLYYLLYGINYEMPSKVAFDPEEPSLGRIRADSIAPPHSANSIKRCIARVEGNPVLSWTGHFDLFADTSESCDTPFKEGHISTLLTDGPGLSPNEPMAIVQVKNPSIIPPERRYVIKNQTWSIYWHVSQTPGDARVYFCMAVFDYARIPGTIFQWDIAHDVDGNISIRSAGQDGSFWVGADMTLSTVPVPWRLIPVFGEFYYLTTDMNRVNHNPRVAAFSDRHHSIVFKGESVPASGSMATLKEGDQYQMWKFSRD